MESTILERLRREADWIRDASLHAAERHYAAETPWFYSAYCLGLPSVICSAVAGVAAFSELQHGKVLAGVLSIVVAVLSALVTFLDPHRKASAYHLSAKGYEALYHQAGYFLRIESLREDAPIKEVDETLGKLMSEFKKLNEHSLPISGRAYRVAEQKIRTGRGEVVRASQDDRPGRHAASSRTTQSDAA
jgi:hypothetical protein